MDIEVARHTVRQAFRTAWELQGTMQFWKERCSAEEYQQYAADIAQAIDAVSVALLNRAMSTYPELKEEIESQIAIHGRYL